MWFAFLYFRRPIAPLLTGFLLVFCGESPFSLPMVVMIIAGSEKSIGKQPMRRLVHASDHYDQTHPVDFGIVS